LEEADVIFVYDYCHYIVWLGHAHAYGSGERDEPGPGDHLTANYVEMMKLPTWKKTDGSQFTFYETQGLPMVHPAFMAKTVFMMGRALLEDLNIPCLMIANGAHVWGCQGS